MKTIGNLFRKLKEPFQQACQPGSEALEKIDVLLREIEDHVYQHVRYLYSHTRLPLKECEAYNLIKALPATEKVELVVYLSEQVNKLHGKAKYPASNNESKRYYVYTNLLDALMRTRIDFPENYAFFDLFYGLYKPAFGCFKPIDVTDRPFGALVIQIEKHVKRFGLNSDLRNQIQAILDASEIKKSLAGKNSTQYWGSDIGKAARKLQRVLFSEDEDGSDTVPRYELGSGKFGALVDADIKAMPGEEQKKWNALFHHLATASAGKPSKKFLTASNHLIDCIGTNQFKSNANKWLLATAMIPVVQSQHTNTYNGNTYTYNTYEYIEAHSFNLLKGLLWSMSRFHDKQSLERIAHLTEKCFQKIPEQGPAAAGVGNAGIYALAQSRGLAGISHLSRLKLRIRQNNTQKLIQKYINEQADNQGVKPAQIEEIAAPAFGLVNAQRVESFDDYQLVLRITAVGVTELQWLKPDGKPQKSVPAFVKDSKKHTAKLKKMRDLAKQIKQTSTAQRDRIDRLYLEDMSWSFDYFNKYYFDHGLVSLVAHNLLWNIDQTPAVYVDDQWQDIGGSEITPSQESIIRLWHPIDSNPDEVLAWRDRLESLGIRQPFKQAHREIYLLTDAEITTRVYSNRMAAHILKQHQFNSLAGLRGWKYALLGAYDDGRDGDVARKLLPAYGLEAQFWINEIIDDTDSFNDAGIWHYVATDQVRFCDTENEPVPLVEIPPLVMTEVMRDIDLFVGVSSVGNDPQWQDGGPDARQDYRDYWHSYSFGDLTEVAKTRKVVLERLIPRLKIRDVAHIDGKFLIVKGHRHNYKIHLGSGNILISPNDKYLCIVPGRGKDKKLDQVFLPFEGDNGLSIVLSKAFLLAEDDKIQDPTILSQLK